MKIYDIIIYEYDQYFSVIQRSPQDENINDAPSEDVALAGKFPINASPSEMGRTIMQAIDNYGQVRPKYAPWELKEIRKQLCNWVGAKSGPDLQRNSRIVLVQKNMHAQKIQIIPFDNFNLNKWETLLESKTTELPLGTSEEELGHSVIGAFSKATFHPDRKAAS